MQRLVTFLLVLLTSLAVSAEPKPQGSAASSGMFVRFTRDAVAAHAIVDYGSTAAVMDATYSQFTKTRGTVGDDCILWGITSSFEMQYLCTKSRYIRITAQVMGYYIDVDEPILFSIGYKAADADPDVFTSQNDSWSAAHGHLSVSVFGQPYNIGTATNITIDMVLNYGDKIGVMAASYAVSAGNNTRLRMIRGTKITFEEVTHIYGAAP